MKHGRRFSALTVLLAGAFSFFLFSCSDDAEGVFYSLETEEKAADNSLPNSVPISGDIIKVPAAVTGSVDRYYVATGSVFYRDAAGGPWNRISSPIRKSIVTGIALAGTDIFVSVSTGSAHGLFRLDPASNYTTYLPANLYSATQIQRLMSLNGTLFAAVGRPTDLPRDLLYWNAGALDATGLTGYPIIAGTFDETNYWFLGPAEGMVFSNASVTGWDPVADKFTVTGTGLEGKSSFSDIFYDSDLASIYICTPNGYIIKSTDSGATWVSSGAYGRNFTSIAKISSGADSIIVFGERGDGAFELTDRTTNDVTAGIRLPGGNFGNLPDLYDSTVLRLLGDGTQLLAGTSNTGVWRADYSNPAYPIWSQE